MMTEITYLCDTNIVSEVLKKNQRVIDKLVEARRLGQSVLISCLTYYEIKRGLLANQANRKILDFEDFCQQTINGIIFLSDYQIIERAALIYADLKRRGRPIQDADILIAATSIVCNSILVSNDSDMQNITGVVLENWVTE